MNTAASTYPIMSECSVMITELEATGGKTGGLLILMIYGWAERTQAQPW